MRNRVFDILKVGQIVQDGDERWEDPQSNPCLEEGDWIPVPFLCINEPVQEGELIRRLQTTGD